MSDGMAKSVMLLGPGAARDEALLYHASTRFANLSLPAGEHLELARIQAGDGHHLRTLVGQDGPVMPASPSGMPVVEWLRGHAGPAGAFVSGVFIDTGGDMELKRVDATLTMCCAFNAVGSLLISTKSQAHVAGREPQLKVAAQVFQQVAAIPVESLLHHPESRTTNIVVDLGNIQEQGAPDSWGAVCSPPDMAGHHWLFVCQDPAAPSKFIYRFVVNESSLRGEVWFTPRTAHQLAEWKFDTEANTRLRALPVHTVAALQLGQDRHSMGVLSKMTSFNEVTQLLAQVQGENKAQVVAMAAGSWEALLYTPGARRCPEAEIRRGHAKCMELSKVLRSSLLPLVDDGSKKEDLIALQGAEQLRQVQAQLIASKGEPRASGPTEGCDPDVKEKWAQVQCELASWKRL